jgi:hypothetical protein
MAATPQLHHLPGQVQVQGQAQGQGQAQEGLPDVADDDMGLQDRQRETTYRKQPHSDERRRKQPDTRLWQPGKSDLFWSPADKDRGSVSNTPKECFRLAR